LEQLHQAIMTLLRYYQVAWYEIHRESPQVRSGIHVRDPIKPSAWSEAKSARQHNFYNRDEHGFDAVLECWTIRPRVRRELRRKPKECYIKGYTTNNNMFVFDKPFLLERVWKAYHHSWNQYHKLKPKCHPSWAKLVETLTLLNLGLFQNSLQIQLLLACPLHCNYLHLKKTKKNTFSADF